MLVSGRLDQRSWESAERERRSKIEITADEVAPSLRWATALITKNERRAPDGASGASGAGGAGGAGGAMANSNAAPSRPVANESADGYHYEEEPF